jgi:chaperone required for assembly of F1-ATPase
MKRFYKAASAEAEADGGATVRLDGRPVRTPGKAALVLPTLALARAVAAEWDAQAEKVVPDTMPLMSLAATAIDRVIPNRDVVAAEAAGFAGTDLLCYRAESPLELAQREADVWDPVLDWARDRFDVRFEVARGLMPVDQPLETVPRFRAAVATRDPFELTALHVMTTAYGSLILALSVVEGAMSAERALEISRVDETYQSELWGVEEEAEKRHQRLYREVLAAERFLALLSDGR